ncbi:MAG: SDR family oxidoreductase [Polyangiaceae bacterium]|nr:SDR family oxidoreductase [Polyangiaceae bacterium]
MLNDLRGKAVLITGGTMGIGLATALAFARQGAAVTMTHKWGTADEDEILRQFRAEGLRDPSIVQADVSRDEDTAALLQQIKGGHDHIEAFISNVSVALVVKGLDDYEKRSLYKSIEYSTWPMFSYTRQIKEMFGQYPRYVVGLSSGGPDAFYKNYDFVAASKAVMETLCRYMSYRLFDEDVRINVVRSRLVRTESLRATFGRDFEEFAERFNMKRQFISCEEVASAILGLCSGLMDGVNGQVIMVDRGTSFFDNLMRIYEERDSLDIDRNEDGTASALSALRDEPH